MYMGGNNLLWGDTPSQVWKAGGTPSQIQMGVRHSADRGYPIQDQDGGGTPSQVQMGVPHSADRGYPIQDQDGVPRMGYPPNPDLGQGGTLPRPSAKRALATQRTVCLLRSRRRTFLLLIHISKMSHLKVIVKNLEE